MYHVSPILANAVVSTGSVAPAAKVTTAAAIPAGVASESARFMAKLIWFPDSPPHRAVRVATPRAAAAVQGKSRSAVIAAAIAVATSPTASATATATDTFLPST